MNFKKAFLFLVLALFLAACGSNENAGAKQNSDTGEKEEFEEIEITFSGDSDNWKGELKAVYDGKREERKLTLTYTGEDYKSIEEVDFEVEGPENFDKEGATLNVQKYLSSSEKSKDQLYTDEEDVEIEVTVDWSGETETLQLEEE